MATMNTRGRERQRAGYVTSKQKRKLIELMSKHPQLVELRVTQDFNYNDSQQLWRNIANECNGIAGAKKTWRQWRKTWQDIRSKIKKKRETDGEVPTFVTKLTTAEQEALGFKNLSPTTNCQESTEFVPLDMNEMHDSLDNDEIDNMSLSEPASPPEVKLFTPSQEKHFTHSQEKAETNKTKKQNTKHSDSCIFNCEMLAIQEQRKLQIKEDYYTFKKDYLKQKIMFMKEQTDALKLIARELGK